MLHPTVFIGDLTLVGVGPGDPSLLTLAAINAIESATVVAYPVARRDGEGMAIKIASEWIREGQQLLPLFFPMVSAAEPRKLAWREASNRLAVAVEDGERVAFLCQGDVSFFASSSYLLLDLKLHHPDCQIRLVPGVTAIAAAAAAGSWPLALQQDQLLVLPTPDQPRDLEAILEEAACAGRVLALLKLGKRWTWVRPLLEKKGLLEGSLFAQRVGWSDQQVLPGKEVSAAAKPYFSLLLVRQNWPKVMP